MSEDLAGTYLALTWHTDSEGNRVPPGSHIHLSHEDAKLALEYKTAQALLEAEPENPYEDTSSEHHEGDAHQDDAKPSE